MAKTELKVGTRSIAVSNLEKVLYPGTGFTKGQVIQYYLEVAESLLPHFKNRPVTLVRFPDGVDAKHFFEKDAPRFTPAWVKTFPVPRNEGGKINYIVINDALTLAWVANLAALELHPFLHRAPRIDTPTHIVFDLDPGEGADILSCARVAFLVREWLEQFHLECFPKVSGSKGLQIYVPIHERFKYEKAKAFAAQVATLLSQEHRDLIVAAMSKALRPGKVFIDWSQNSATKTTVGVYSLRAKRDRPFVSMPVSWDEIKRAVRLQDPAELFFEPERALRRLKEVGDLFAPLLTLKQSLPRRLPEAGVQN